MSDMTDPDVLEPVTRTCQIIVAALIMGVVFFLAIIILFIPGQMMMVPAPGGGAAVPGPANPSLPLITYIAVAIGLADLAMSFVIPGLSVTRLRRQIALGKASKMKGNDTSLLAQVYQTQLIIGAALLEGGAFFAAIAYMLERQTIAVGMALVLLVVLAARFPTRDRISAWLDQQLTLLQEERGSSL